jgi:hypothetical protein
MTTIERLAVRAMAAILLLPAAALGSVNEPLDLTPFVNVDLTCYTRGAAYPQQGGVIQIGGVPFTLLAGPADSHTSIIQLLSDPGVFSQCIKYGPREVARPGQQVAVTLPIQRSNVNAVYLLVNSAYGRCGAEIGAVELAGRGETYRYPLKEGVTVRDHFNGRYCNSISEFSGIANYGDVRLDAQRIELPRSFAGSLDRIVLRGFTGQRESGAPFFAAITLNRYGKDVHSGPRSGDEVIPQGALRSVLKYASPLECLPHATTQYCTPPGSSVAWIGPGLYKMVLPAHLVYGATVPNPGGRKIQVMEQSGVVCLPTGASGKSACFEPATSRSPGGAGYLDPAYAPGALLYRTVNGETQFSINGRTGDQVPINGSNARAFRGYEGHLEFTVRIVD